MCDYDVRNSVDMKMVQIVVHLPVESNFEVIYDGKYQDMRKRAGKSLCTRFMLLSG